MKQKKLKLGIVCLARKTFDYKEAHAMYKTVLEQLRTEFLDVEFIAIEDLVIEIEESITAGERFVSENVDGLVLISGTFHLGHLALEIEKRVQKPILLWGFPELPYNGGRIRLNSACGVNLNASNLYKAGVTASCHIGSTIDTHWLNALQTKTYISNCKLGMVGSHAHGFYNLGFEDLDLFKKLGVLIHFYDLHLLWSQDISQDDIAEWKKHLLENFSQGNVNDNQITLVAKLIASMKKFMDSNNLDGIALRGWPEFAQEYGIAPYAAMSVLQSLGYVIANEGDIEGLVSMMIAKSLYNENPFLADFSQIFFEENRALMWHMGEAPYNLWDKKSELSLDNYFADGKGVTADFVLQSGELDMFRVDSARGKTRIYFVSGVAEPMEKLLRGSYAKVAMKGGVQKAFDTITSNGIAHHLACVYGSQRKAIGVLARMYDFEIIE